MNQLVNVNQFEKKILIKYKDEDLFSLMVTENHQIEYVLNKAAEYFGKSKYSLYIQFDGQNFDEKQTIQELRIRKGEILNLMDKLQLKIQFEGKERIYDAFLIETHRLRDLESEFEQVKQNLDSLQFYKGQQLLDDKKSVGQLNLVNGDLIVVKEGGRLYKYQFQEKFFEENLQGRETIKVSQFLQIAAQKINKDPNNLVLLCFDIEQDENKQMNQLTSKVDLKIDERFNLTIIFDTLNQPYNLKVQGHEQVLQIQRQLQIALNIQYEISFTLDQNILNPLKTLEQNKVKPGMILKAKINYPSGYLNQLF